MNGHGRRAVLGIDLGTSGVKALVADLDGVVLGRGMAGYPVLAPGEGKAEAEPQAWWRATRLAVRDALAEAGGARVLALAVAGQMHGVVLTDDRGMPMRPAILWLDQRATAEAAGYTDSHGEYIGVLGNRPSPGMAGPILCWLAAHEPATLRASWWALQPKDWLRLRLTGHAATDPTDASGTLLFDLAANEWAADLVKRLGIRGELLPPVRESSEVAGTLLSGPAAELGLNPGIPVAVGAADTAAALYAVGDSTGPAAAFGDESWAVLNLGSGGQWVVPEGEFKPTGSTNLYRAVGGGYYRLSPVQNVGVTLNWVRGLVGASWEELYDTASRPRRPDAPRFDPYLTPERWDPTATGAWTGLMLAHGREDLMRSALDGVAALLRQRLDDLRAAGHAPARVILGGGGTAHPAWRALLEATLGLPLTPAPATWLTSTGAARIAAASLLPRKRPEFTHI